MIIKVPAGKERDWVSGIGKPEYKNLINSVSLIAIDPTVLR